MKTLISLFLLLFFKMTFAFDMASKPINVIMPFGAGGGVDQTFRSLEKFLLNQNVKMVPIYKPGANGVIAGNELFKSEPDGYTIYIGTVTTLAEFENKNTNKKVSNVSLIRNPVMSIISNKIKTFEELENAIKNNKRIILGYTAPDQIRFFKEFYTKINKDYSLEPVAYKSVPQMLQDLGGDNIDVSVIPMSIGKTMIDSKKAILLAHDNDTAIDGYEAVSLPKRYKNWTKFGGFALALPPNIDKNIEKHWLNIVSSYSTNSDIQKEWRHTLMMSTPLGKESLEMQIQLYKLQ
jgi:tripartite-type tricarboxylate transporter receptor subunit TctC